MLIRGDVVTAGADVRARPRTWACAAATLVALVLSGCSGETASDGAGSTSPNASAASAEFCGAAVDASRVLGDGPGLAEGAARPDVAAAFNEYKARLEPPLSVIETSAPEAVRQDVGTLARQARFAIAANDPTAVETPEFQAADERLRAFVRQGLPHRGPPGGGHRVPVPGDPRHHRGGHAARSSSRTREPSSTTSTSTGSTTASRSRSPRSPRCPSRSGRPS